MVLGEYQSLTPSKEDAFNQLKFLFDHGVQAIDVGHWPPAFDKGYNASMYEAVRRLLELDQPRPGMTGGVGQIRAYQRDGRRFDLAVVGTGPNHTGLIKSLRRDGGWEGTVYVVPFHAHVEIVPVLAIASRTLKSGEALTAGPLDHCDAGNQVELVFEARTSSRIQPQPSHSTAPGGSIGIDVCNGKVPLPGLRTSMPVDPDWRYCRFLLRTPLPVDGIVVRMSVPDQSFPVEIRNLKVLRHNEAYARVHRGALTGKRHQGGVTFDILH
jgi:hypothetical protein